MFLPKKTNMNPSELDQLCAVAAGLHDRGYAFGSTGSLSLRADDYVWITPTDKPLSGLTTAQLACLAPDGRSLNRNAPPNDSAVHLAIYRCRPDVNAAIHLYSNYAVAVSCLERLDPVQPLPILTPQYLMSVVPLAVIPYFPLGSEQLAEAVATEAQTHQCLLLRNQGSMCMGSTLSEALNRAEVLEANARLFFLLRDLPVHTLDGEARNHAPAANQDAR
ncbi:MAG: class II aldolase/adducin family protein [Acidobacteriota bacterium]